MGTLSHTGCLRFHTRKEITICEVGMYTTKDDHLAERWRRLRDHGDGMSDLHRHLAPSRVCWPTIPSLATIKHY